MTDMDDHTQLQPDDTSGFRALLALLGHIYPKWVNVYDVTMIDALAWLVDRDLAQLVDGKSHIGRATLAGATATRLLDS